MSQPEESHEKTAKTDNPLLRPDEDPHRSTAQIAPLDEGQQGQVRVERGGRLRPVEDLVEEDERRQSGT